MLAIEKAVSIISNLTGDRFVIFSDSYSSLKVLTNPYTDHPTARKILHKIDRLLAVNEKKVEMCWIPSHTGIPKNEDADRAANNAASMPEQHAPIYYKDWIPLIKQKIKDSWRVQWLSKPQKLHEIKRDINPFSPAPQMDRRKEVILNRLRTGHTRFSHGHLMDSSVPNFPPLCPYCNNDIITVKHVLLECPDLETARNGLTPINATPLSLNLVLGEYCNYNKLLNFLENIGLISEV